MIKKLRRKFILIAMGSTFLVVALLMSVINIVNIYQIEKRTDGLLNVISESGGTIPDYKQDKFEHISNEFGTQINEETSFETRYFTIGTNAHDQIVSIYTGHIAAVSPDEAKRFAQTVIDSNKEKGYIKNYKYLKTSSESGGMIIFLDCRQFIQTSASFLLISVLVSLLGLLAVFVLIFIFSKYAINPVIESMNKQKQFITDAGHEIKTPLAIISANNDVMELNSGETEWTKSTKNQIKRLNLLIKDLLTLAKTEEDGVKIVFAPFSASDAVKNTAYEFKTLAESQNKEFITDIDDGITINGDESAIRQLTSILTDNAVKYAPENGFVKVSLKPHGKSAVLKVENSCDSPPKGDMSRLFDRFYRDDSSRARQTGGYGIGLSIAKAIVESHKGKISAETSKEGTVIFTAVL